jgi:hypothetical protein
VLLVASQFVIEILPGFAEAAQLAVVQSFSLRKSAFVSCAILTSYNLVMIIIILGVDSIEG